MENKFNTIRNLLNRINQKVIDPIFMELNENKSEVIFCIGEQFVVEYMPLDIAISWLEGINFSILNISPRKVFDI